MALDWTLPGAGAAEVELRAGGADRTVRPGELGEYLEAATRSFLYESVRPMVDEMAKGVADFVPPEALKCFTAHELQSVLCGGADEDWSEETILAAIVPAHGYSAASPPVRMLVRVLAGLEAEHRRAFLLFVTGAPRLPVGGFASLSPRLTVVKRGVEPGAEPGDYLPSCSTCQVYLKLPPYSSEASLRKRLMQAIVEGTGHFAFD